MSEIKTFFTDKIVSKPSFEIKPTLGSTPGAPGNTTSVPSGSVGPKELPKDSLKHGTS
jgi:hypothetical protein